MKKPNCAQCTLEMYQANRTWCDENCDFEKSEKKHSIMNEDKAIELIEFIDEEMRMFDMGNYEDYDYERDLHIRNLAQKVKLLATPDFSKSVEPVGEGEGTVCECSIPMTTMELPHRCVKCNKPIKWDEQTIC